MPFEILVPRHQRKGLLDEISEMVPTLPLTRGGLMEKFQIGLKMTGVGTIFLSKPK